MSIRKLPQEVYRNLKKLELSAETKSAVMEETLILEKEADPDDEDIRPHYWFILMLSFGQRSGYVYDREGLHIPDPERFTYSIELWKFRGVSLKSVETKLSKVDFDEALKQFQALQKEIQGKGFKVITY